MVFLVIPASFGAALLLTAGLNWLALIPWRRSAGQHWTERARRLWPVRVGARLNVLFCVPGICVLAGGIFWRDDQPALWLFGICGWLGALLASWYFDHETFPFLNFTGWLHQVGASWLLSLAWWFLFIGAAVAMPDEFGWQTAALAAAVLAMQLSLNLGLAVWCLRRLRILGPPPERLERIVAASARELPAGPPRVWLLKGAASYAAALPFTRELIFSQRLLDLHPDEEISAICAHELGHLSESRAVMAGRLVGSLTLFPLLFLKPALQLQGLAKPLVLVLLAAIVIVLPRLARKLARKMEVRADQLAKAGEAGEGVYARALERLHEANQVPAVMRGNRMTHPHLYDRMLAAGVTPAYPRPKPPGRFAWNTALSLALLILLLAMGYGVMGYL